MINCAECNRPVDQAHYQEVQGWVRVRVEGGANAIKMRHNTGRVMCIACMLVMDSPQREKMF
jgi:hypothetical protein